MPLDHNRTPGTTGAWVVRRRRKKLGFPALKRLKRGLWRGLLALTAAAILGMLLGQWGDVLWQAGKGRTTGLPPMVAEEQGGPSRESATREILTEAQTVWRAFQQADAPAVQLGLMHDPDGLGGDLGAQWSAAGGENPDKEMPGRVVTVEALPFSSPDLVAVTLESRNSSSSPVRLYFRKSAGGLRLDWPAWQQLKQQSLDQFLAGGAEVGVFRLGLRRRHVFGELASAAGGGAVLRIIHLDGREEPRLLVVDPQDAVWTALENTVGWEGTQAVIARLGWKRFPDGRRRLELKELRAWGAETL